MNGKIKLIYGIFFCIFIVAGLSMSVFGFVKLAQYKLAKEIDATVSSAEYNFERNEFDILFKFEFDDKYCTANVHFNGIEYKDGRLPYYEGQETKIRVNGKNEIIFYGKKEIILTVSGCLFFIAGSAFLYFGVLRKQNFFDLACDYENAMLNPEDLDDDTAKYEARADELSKLPAYNIKRQVGEVGITINRMSDRFKSFSIPENIFYGALLVGLMVLFGIILKSIAFGILCGLFAFVICGLVLKLIKGLYFRILIKTGKFSEKKLATVIICAFESAGSFQTSDLSRSHIIFKKFRVVADTDGKRSIGYVLGNVPPPKGSVLKVLVRPRKLRRWIIDNN